MGGAPFSGTFERFRTAADLERPPAPIPQAAPTFTPLEAASAFNETIFFGGTTWAPDSMRWGAIQDSVWTFDTGIGNGMEGWTGIDETADPTVVQYFRRVSTADPRWSPDAPCFAVPTGQYAFWAGVFPAEASSLCHDAGMGYGNGWNICIGHDFEHHNGTVTLEYD